MKLKAMITVNLEKEKELLVVVTDTREGQWELYYELALSAPHFKMEIADQYPHIDFVTAGYWNEQNEIVWQQPLIPLPELFGLKT